MTSVAAPVRLRARLDTPLSRWLWLVKWLLVVPHAVVLALLWVAFAVLSVVAFAAILVTGRYPHSIFTSRRPGRPAGCGAVGPAAALRRRAERLEAVVDGSDVRQHRRPDRLLHGGPALPGSHIDVNAFHSACHRTSRNSGALHGHSWRPVRCCRGIATT
jgi:hypothetical protein